jgi:hypothetical protein
MAKRGLTMPRLEMVAGHTTANLVSNVATAIREERVSLKSQSEAKVTREVLAAAVAKPERDDYVQ